MTQHKLALWLKVIIVGIGLCGLAVYGGVVPVAGREIVASYPEFSRCYAPWLGLIWISGVPCYGVLLLAWRVACSIGKGQSFTRENAVSFRWMSRLALGDSIFFFAMNALFLLLNMNHPSILLAALLVCCCGMAVYVIAAGLAQLTDRAAELQEQSDLTI